jgi:hypothetical protein
MRGEAWGLGRGTDPTPTTASGMRTTRATTPLKAE